ATHPTKEGETRMKTHVVPLAIVVLLLVSLSVMAQMQNDVIPLRTWSAPLYWQPTSAEREAAANKLATFSTKANAATQGNSLVFVAMRPCRIAPTRDGTYPPGFGPPILSGNMTRTFAIQSPSSRCPVQSIAQAYSFNITVVPPGAAFPGNVNPGGALGYLT